MSVRTFITGLLLIACSTRVSAVQYPPFYPEVGLYGDTLHAPFIYGVASGDPTQESLIIWSKIHPRDSAQNIEIYFEVSRSERFDSIVQHGRVMGRAEDDFNLKIDIEGLEPGQTYYYRFWDHQRHSVTGKGKTLPSAEVAEVCFAFVSCSCVMAGYFNAYRRISEREDLDFLVHLGDYAYDYPDKRQHNRIPGEVLRDVQSASEWRDRHRLYLLDPDLREARRQKSWIAVWDNHDIDLPDKRKTLSAMKVFYDYMPIRKPWPEHPERIYRSFRLGSLADLIMIDMFSKRGREEIVPGVPSVLGSHQDAWLQNELEQSTAAWRVLGNQEMMADWLSEGAPRFVRKRSGDGRVFDTRSWGGYPADRQRLFDFLKEREMIDNLVISGDIHMAFVMDLTGTPKDRRLYSQRKGYGAVGGELCTPSITRINMRDAGVPHFIIKPVQWMSRCLNPHHHWVDFGYHGYTTVHITQDFIHAEVWHVPTHKVTDRHRFRRGVRMNKGEGQWSGKRYRRSMKK